jgi:hypothetical protein
MKTRITILLLGMALSAASADEASQLRAILVGAKASAIRFFEWFGEWTNFCVQLARAAFVPPFEMREFARQLDELGSKSLPLVAVAGAATGVVLSLETRDSLLRFGAKSLLPAVVVFSIIKESGPIITALVVCGRVAAGIGAQLGAMKVTEQIDGSGETLAPGGILQAPQGLGGGARTANTKLERMLGRRTAGGKSNASHRTSYKI